ncbi:hypothetical protein [Pseudoxanthomonas mexicana]|uniref:hypothetical protein n=1 Tax=Pseudoxanthomonas mexicana TaxID=128785 RepID=UPI000782FAAF|nr:hypothetical protein [Pseudoxanthomonas mexicana]
MNTKSFLTYEGFLLAFAPLAGILISYFYQIGRYAFYDASFELIELSTPKIIVASISVLVVSSAYAISWLSNAREDGRWKLPGILGHVFYNAVLTVSFWFRTDRTGAEILLSLIICVVVGTIGTYWLQHTVMRWRDADGGGGRILSRYFCVVYLFFMFALLSAYSGYSNANSQRHLVIAGSSSVVVGTFNGSLVTKSFDQKSGVIEPDTTILVPIPERVALRNVEMRLRHAD